MDLCAATRWRGISSGLAARSLTFIACGMTRWRIGWHHGVTAARQHKTLALAAKALNALRGIGISIINGSAIVTIAAHGAGRLA